MMLRAGKGAAVSNVAKRHNRAARRNFGSRNETSPALPNANCRHVSKVSAAAAAQLAGGYNAATTTARRAIRPRRGRQLFLSMRLTLDRVTPACRAISRCVASGFACRASDIWRAADLLIRKQRADAELEAAKRADLMLDRGDGTDTQPILGPRYHPTHSRNGGLRPVVSFTTNEKSPLITGSSQSPTHAPRG